MVAKKLRGFTLTGTGFKNLLFVLLIGTAFPQRNTRQEEYDQCGENGRGNGHPLMSTDHIQGYGENAPPDHNFTKIVRMPGDTPKSL